MCNHEYIQITREPKTGYQKGSNCSYYLWYQCKKCKEKKSELIKKKDYFLLETVAYRVENYKELFPQ